MRDLIIGTKETDMQHDAHVFAWHMSRTPGEWKELYIEAMTRGAHTMQHDAHVFAWHMHFVKLCADVLDRDMLR